MAIVNEDMVLEILGRGRGEEGRILHPLLVSFGHLNIS